jgi:hypothetical protein
MGEMKRGNGGGQDVLLKILGELQGLREEFTGEQQKLRVELHGLRNELRGEIQGLRSGQRALAKAVATLAAATKRNFDELRTGRLADHERRLVRLEAKTSARAVRR